MLKKTSIKTLYRLFAFLSDKTNGFAPFVKYKLTLGALLIGLGACSNNIKKSPEEETKNKDTNSTKEVVAEIVEENILCYLSEISTNDIEASQTDNDIFIIVDQQPEYPGGYEAMKEFIYKNLQNPDPDACIHGRVVLNFIVEKNGTISDINVVRGIEPKFDKEAVRVVQLMPKWIPGKQKGENVRVRFTLPISFRKERP